VAFSGIVSGQLKGVNQGVVEGGSSDQILQGLQQARDIRVGAPAPAISEIVQEVQGFNGGFGVEPWVEYQIPEAMPAGGLDLREQPELTLPDLPSKEELLDLPESPGYHILPYIEAATALKDLAAPAIGGYEGDMAYPVLGDLAAPASEEFLPIIIGEAAPALEELLKQKTAIREDMARIIAAQPAAVRDCAPVCSGSYCTWPCIPTLPSEEKLILSATAIIADNSPSIVGACMCPRWENGILYCDCY
jgi:hypothetical protein